MIILELHKNAFLYTSLTWKIINAYFLMSCVIIRLSTMTHVGEVQATGTACSGLNT